MHFPTHSICISFRHKLLTTLEFWHFPYIEQVILVLFVLLSTRVGFEHLGNHLDFPRAHTGSSSSPAQVRAPRCSPLCCTGHSEWQQQGQGCAMPGLCQAMPAGSTAASEQTRNSCLLHPPLLPAHWSAGKLHPFPIMLKFLQGFTALLDRERRWGEGKMQSLSLGNGASGSQSLG